MVRCLHLLGLGLVALGAWTVLAFAVPHHPFYGTRVEMERIRDADEGTGYFEEDPSERLDRFAYGFLGLILCGAGSMMADRFGRAR